ncbi:MAG: transposase, partial [Flavobacteriaceae bacterium]|nr:transposase [Flavobacteriaceae bacterium]
MKKLQEIYIDFGISSFEKIEMTKLVQVIGTQYSHDIFTKMLLQDATYNDKDLWAEVKPFLRNYENEQDGCIIIDDTILKKPHTKENDIVCKHFDHNSGKYLKGIELLNFHYTDFSGISIPLGYEIVTKTEMIFDKKKKKWVRKSLFTKNEIMRDKLNILHNHNQVKYKYILFDKWFASTENWAFIDMVLNKKFVSPVKKNRLVALTLEDKINGKYVSISELDMEGDSSRLVYFKGYEKPLIVARQVFKNGDDDKFTYLYLATNDIDLCSEKILEIYKRRWKIEEYHKSLKQNMKIEHSPTKVEKSQRNHIFLSVCGFIKLEKLRLNYNMSHFTIKEKIYIEAVKIAYQKVKEL